MANISNSSRGRRVPRQNRADRGQRYHSYDIGESMVSNKSIKIVRDLNCDSRDWDNLGTMVCWHNRYKLGDEQPTENQIEYNLRLAQDCEISPQDCLNIIWDIHDNHPDSLEDFFYYAGHEGIDKDTILQALQEMELIPDGLDEIIAQTFVILPLYLYDHSGITMNTTGFHCPWDSGKVGFIYAKADAEDLEREQIEKNLKGEVLTYDDYLRGDVWGFQILGEDEEIVDSCYGFYGNKIDGLLSYIPEELHAEAIEAWEEKI